MTESADTKSKFIALKFAAIDIGSNALRLLITEVIENGSGTKYKKRLFIRVPLRLGEDVFTIKRISDEKTYSLIKAIHAFRNLIDLYSVTDYKACATSAFREAGNGHEVADKIFSHTGFFIDVIDGKKEAEIIYTNHVAESLDVDHAYLYVDVGGGSTEITLFSKGKIIDSNSFPVGAVRMCMDKVSEKSWDALKEFVKDVTKGYDNLIAIGTGGNINKLVKMADNKDKKYLKEKELKELFEKLSGYTIEERIHKLGLNTDRADVIVPAARIYLSVLKWARIEEIFVPKLGLADGIIHMLYEKHLRKKTASV
jgi:exopolyphosphatase/guanosine-5'-triphosphate,3'-diphosphate pyrophosphatase